jgi:RHS repeat-associated protein
VEYTYDLFDRRIARQVDADGTAGFETTQRFVYDGEDLILAFSGTTNVLSNRYLYGPATDEILADEKITTGTAGTVTWSLGDNLGTIRDLVQYNAATGTTTVVNHVRYDTFGQIVSQTNSQFQPWFAYTGREWDPAAGLYFYRARWYDPRAGRFLSEDPIGFAAGDVNLNRYVGNGATLWVDPSGMENQAPSGGLAVNPVQTGTIDVEDVVTQPGMHIVFQGIPIRASDQMTHELVLQQLTAWETFLEWLGYQQTRTSLGMVSYQTGNFEEQRLAREIARKMQIAAGLGEIKITVAAGTELTKSVVQTSNPVLDVIVDTVELAHNPTLAGVGNFVGPAAAGALVGKLVNKTTDVVDDLQLPQGTPGPTPKRAAPSSTWTRPPGWRLPHNGTWSGAVGHSDFIPSNPSALGVPPGTRIPFRNGYPDFSQWQRGNPLNVHGLNGNHAHDMPLIHQEVARLQGLPTQTAGEAWLRQQGLTPHHAGGNTVQLIPRDLHGGVRHMGGARELRIR